VSLPVSFCALEIETGRVDKKRRNVCLIVVGAAGGYLLKGMQGLAGIATADI
jgi:hypothetical protein